MAPTWAGPRQVDEFGFEHVFSKSNGKTAIARRWARDRACAKARHGTPLKIWSKATIPELYSQRVEEHVRSRHVRKEAAREAERDTITSRSGTAHLEAVLRLAAMLAALCRTAPAVIGMS